MKTLQCGFNKQQVTLVANLWKLDNLKSVILLFLDEAVFTIYEQLSDEDKEDADSIKEALMMAFSTDYFQVYDKFHNYTH